MIDSEHGATCTVCCVNLGFCAHRLNIYAENEFGRRVHTFNMTWVYDRRIIHVFCLREQFHDKSPKNRLRGLQESHRGEWGILKSFESMGCMINKKMNRSPKSPKKQAQGPIRVILGGMGDFKVF